MTRPAAPAVLRVGLTGNIGAGKTTVAGMMGARGCLVIDADRIAHELLAPGGDAVEPVLEAWGSDLARADGGVDRGRLASIVFADDDARRRLEAMLHPRIHQIEQERVGAWDVGRGIAVTEAALLVETGSASRYHRLVVVTAPETVRLQRLESRGLARADARRRMRAQMPEAEKAAAADYRVDNGASRQATERQVDALLTRLDGDLDRLSAGRLRPRSGQ